jgi:molybdopterin-guanine dinucleotide biosynthesis protein A
LKQFDTAIIIAGGKSTRMGFDKAFMRIGNSYCIELLIRKLKKNFNEIIIVTENSKKHDFMNDAITDFMNVTITSDIIKNAGPLGGLHAGLKASSSMHNYLVACDMPVISDELIVHMKDLLFLKPDIIACENNGFIEPFHAVYMKPLISKIEREVKTGNYSLYNLMLKSNTEIIPFDKLKKICKSLSLFTNLNTRQELNRFIKEVDYTG